MYFLETTNKYFTLTNFKSLTILSIILLDLSKLCESRVCVQFLSQSFKVPSRLPHIAGS